MKQKELNNIIEKHQRWLNCESEGQRADLSGADLIGADLSEVNLSRANLSGAVLYGANLYGADLSAADLTGADLYGAVLTEAVLTGAVLTGAVLYGANLTGADLEDTILEKTPIASFQFEKHMAVMIGGNIQIGCLKYSINKWVKEYRAIGIQKNYTQEQIQAYGDFIKYCAKLKL